MIMSMVTVLSAVLLGSASAHFYFPHRGSVRLTRPQHGVFPFRLHPNDHHGVPIVHTRGPNRRFIPPPGAQSPVSRFPLHSRSAQSPVFRFPIHPRSAQFPFSRFPIHPRSAQSPVSGFPLPPPGIQSPVSGFPLPPPGIQSPVSGFPFAGAESPSTSGPSERSALLGSNARRTTRSLAEIYEGNPFGVTRTALSLSGNPLPDDLDYLFGTMGLLTATNPLYATAGLLRLTRGQDTQPSPIERSLLLGGGLTSDNPFSRTLAVDRLLAL